MFCPNCRNQVTDSAEFCPHCDTNLKEIQQTPSFNQTVYNQQPTSNNQNKKKSFDFI